MKQDLEMIQILNDSIYRIKDFERHSKVNKFKTNNYNNYFYRSWILQVIYDMDYNYPHTFFKNEEAIIALQKNFPIYFDKSLKKYVKKYALVDKNSKEIKVNYIRDILKNKYVPELMSHPLNDKYYIKFL